MRKPCLFFFVQAAAFVAAFAPDRSLAIECGNGVCNSGAIPPETCATCPSDCGPCRRDFICSYPELQSASISDCQEGPLTPPSYMYMTESGGAKTGDLPPALGTGERAQPGGPTLERTEYDTDVWASNFQGLERVTGKSARPQWEWRCHLGEADSSRRYPLKQAAVCRALPSGTLPTSLGSSVVRVKEADECFLIFCNPDEGVGSFRVNHDACVEQVFSRGFDRGWTAPIEQRGRKDIEAVRYRSWCYRCRNALDCPQTPANGVWNQSLTFRPPVVSFGSVAANSVQTQTLTIQNSVGATVDLSFPASPPESVFQWTAFSGTLAPAAQRSVEITFRPKTTAIMRATLTVTSTAPGSPHSIGITGKGPGGFEPGSAGTLEFRPQPITFGSVSLGTRVARTLTIENRTGETVRISFPASPPNSPFQWSAFSGALAHGERRSFQLTFQPKSGAIARATLIVTSTAAGSPHSIGLIGKGSGGF